MAKRVDITDPFAGGLSPESADEQLYGKVEIGKNAGKTRIRPIEILKIQPDPLQPRRAIPSQIRGNWQPNPNEIAQFLEHWIAESKIDIAPYFAAETDQETPDPENPTQAALIPVLQLAASIQRSGLTNPITVTKDGADYRLETGERRWMAFHLLHLLQPENDEWEKIPARIMDAHDLWRQAAENNARENLNAIGRARQYALLLMDLLRESGKELQPFSAFQSEREFYAQVVDERAPYGKNEQLMSAMGFTSRVSASRCRSLLTLPDEAWQIGDDYNLPQETLYEWSQLDHQSATEAAQQIVSGRNNSEEQSKPKASVVDYSPGTKRHFGELSRALKQIGTGRSHANQQALEKLAEMRQWIDEQENIIRRFLE